MISFRPLAYEDKETIRRWRNLPQVRHYMFTDHIISPEEHAAWFDSIFDNPSYRYWIIRCDEEDVGLLNLYDIDTHNRRCQYGFYVIGPNVRGKTVGMFTEYFALQYIFAELRLHKVCCPVLAFNRGVLRMHEAFGFVQEGHLRSHIVRSDGTHDVICMGILKCEWEKRQPQFEKIFRSRGLI